MAKAYKCDLCGDMQPGDVQATFPYIEYRGRALFISSHQAGLLMEWATKAPPPLPLRRLEACTSCLGSILLMTAKELQDRDN